MSGFSCSVDEHGGVLTISPGALVSHGCVTSFRTASRGATTSSSLLTHLGEPRKAPVGAPRYKSRRGRARGCGAVSPTRLQLFALCPFLPARAPYPMCFPLSARVSRLQYSSHMVVAPFQSVCLFPEQPGTQRIFFPPVVSCPGRRRSLVALNI